MKTRISWYKGYLLFETLVAMVLVTSSILVTFSLQSQSLAETKKINRLYILNKLVQNFTAQLPVVLPFLSISNESLLQPADIELIDCHSQTGCQCRQVFQHDCVYSGLQKSNCNSIEFLQSVEFNFVCGLAKLNSALEWRLETKTLINNVNELYLKVAPAQNVNDSGCPLDTFCVESRIIMSSFEHDFL